jgi:hypothetical protein
MPRRPTAAEFRVDSVVAGLKPTIPLLTELTDAFGTPFLPAISVTIASLVTGIQVQQTGKQFRQFNFLILQTIKKNKEECVGLLEDIHGVLYAIVGLHIKSETPGSIPPTILHYIGRFTE